MPRSPKRPAPGDISGAVQAPIPAKVGPQLATLVSAPPERGTWSYEVKFDGYRLLARFNDGKAALITRGGHDWSSKMPALVAELETLGIESGVLDGEIVMSNAKGVPDFNALQKAFDRPTSSAKVEYFAFDVLFLDGYDVRKATQTDRCR